MNAMTQNMTILTDEQATSLLKALPPPFDLIGELMYRTGLRLQEILALRVKDVNLETGVLYVRRTNGSNDRMVSISPELGPELRLQLEASRKQHSADLHGGVGVILPLEIDAWLPLARTRWCWQYLFPSPEIASDPVTRQPSRAHVSSTAFQRALRNAARRAGLGDAIHSHSLRHACAARLVEQGADLSEIQSRMGHDDLKTTARYAREIESEQQAGRHAPAPCEPDRSWITHFSGEEKAPGFFARVRGLAAIF